MELISFPPDNVPFLRLHCLLGSVAIAFVELIASGGAEQPNPDPDHKTGNGFNKKYVAIKSIFNANFN